MDTMLIVLYSALALVFLIALVCEIVRLTNGYRSLKEDAERANRTLPRVVVVQQNQGEVRFAYLATADTHFADTYSVRAEETAAAAEPAAKQAVEFFAQSQKECVAETEETDAADDQTVFAKSERLTYEEKYEKLDEADKKLIDEFSAFVSGLSDCSSTVQTSALAFKYKKGHIAKAVIRRDTVVLHFAISNPELDRMMRSEKIKDVKVKPVEIRLIGEEDLDLAKQTAEITVKYLRDEEEYRLEKRKEARREAAARKRAAQNNAGEDSAL